MVRPLVSGKELLLQLEFIGVRSFWIIVLASVMVGGVFGIQFGQIFRMFGMESLIGAAASFALSKEIAPVIGSFLVTGRAGSAMTAEIANMKVNEQIDALRVMSINPISYLCAPRVLAGILITPLLAGLFVFCGVISAYVTGVAIFAIDSGIFFEKIRWITRPLDLVQGLEKAAIFGGIFSTIACYSGFHASGGAKGVGQATTNAVVFALVAILISDFFLSYFQTRPIFP